MVVTPLPPGPRARVPGAHLLAFARDMLGFVCRLKHDYGDVVAFRLGPERTVLLSHPEHLHEVLVRQHRAFQKGRRGDVSKQWLGEGLLNSEGARHQHQRRLLQPALHRQHLAEYATVMTTHAARLSQAWQDGDTLDITPAMMRVTLAIAAQTLLDADVEAEASAIGQAITTLVQGSARVPLPLAPLVRRLPLPSQRRLRRAEAYLDTLIYQLIDARRVQGGEKGDVLTMLLDARTEDGRPLSPRQIHDEALTLLLAGHETTALALSWTWYLLAQHPDVDAMMQAELQTVLGGRLPTAEDLPQLRYTRMVFTEALRLYPPAWLMTRRAREEVVIGDYCFPPGTFFLLSPYLMHHDARFFPEPEAFVPTRWAAPPEAGHARYAYLPFGGGPRQCLGEGFAWMEGLLVLTTLAQTWRMELVPGPPVAPWGLVTLRPKQGIPLHLTRRCPRGPTHPGATEMEEAG
jgi:cytochrome P450